MWICTGWTSSSCGVDVVNHLLGDGRSHRSHLIRGIQPDLDLTMPVIDRRMRYIEVNDPSWSNEIARIVMGVVLTGLAKVVTSHAMGESEINPSSDQLADIDIFDAKIHLSLGKKVGVD